MKSQEQIEHALEKLQAEITRQSDECLHTSHPFDKDRKRFVIHGMQKVRSALEWVLNKNNELNKVLR